MNSEFAVHKLNDEGMKKAKLIAESFDSLLKTISIVCFDGREMAICRTKLEEACFFAKKAMAIGLNNQQEQWALGGCDKNFTIPQTDNLSPLSPQVGNPLRMNAPDEKY